MFGLTVASVGFSFITGVLLARILGASNYGVYAYAGSLVGLLGVLTNFGINNLLVREIASGQARSAWGRINGILRWIDRVVLTVAVVVSLASAATAWMFRERVQPEALFTFFIALFLLPLFSLTAIRRAALRGLRHVILGRLTESFIRPLLFITLVSVAYFALRVDLDAPMVMVLRVAGASIVLLVGSMILHRMTPRALKDAVPEYHTRIWLGSALPFAVIFGMQTMNDQANVVILGALTSSDQVGIYAAAVRLAEAIILIFTAVEFTIAPYIAGLYTSEQTARLQNLILKTTRVVLVLSLPVALAFIFFGDWFLALFGEEFRAGKWALAILGTGRLLNVAFGPVKALALMTGQERTTAWIMGIVAFLNVVLNLFLVPFWGIIGAALATAISTVAWSSMLCVLVYRRIGVISFAVSLHRSE